MPNVEEIADSDELYRRLAPEHINPDGSVNSAAFKLRGRPDPQISVEVARLTTPQESLGRTVRPGFQLGILLAAIPRALNLTVRHDPLPDNDAHALIIGTNSKTICRRLAEATSVLDLPVH